MTPQLLIDAAMSKLGEREHPPHSNDGPFVRNVLAGVHTPPGQPWCAAFVCWCVWAANAGTPPWFHPSAGALSLWYSNEPLHVPRGELPQVGDIVIWSHGHGHGHAGIVTEVEGKLPLLAIMHVIAGNTTNGRDYTDPAVDRTASREGDQVGINVYPVDDVRIVGYLRCKWEA